MRNNWQRRKFKKSLILMTNYLGNKKLKYNEIVKAIKINNRNKIR